MVVGKGEKLHVMYRSFYEKSARRHFVGEVIEVLGAICRLEGYAFIFDDRKGEFSRKPEKRITIINVAESGYVSNVISPNVVISDVRYRYIQDVGLVATDGKEFTLNINEFGARG